MSGVPTLITALVGAVLVTAAGFMTLRTGSNTWLSLLYTLASAALLGASVAARYGRGSARAFWFGFAVVGWGFWVLGLGVSPVTDRGAGGSSTSLQANEYLLTTTLLKSVHNTLKPPANLAQVGHYGNRLATEYVLLTLVLALGGGLAASVLSRRSAQAQAGRWSESGRIRVVAWSTVALALVGLLGAVSYLEPPRTAYFPESVTSEDDGLEPGIVDAATRSLTTMREPSLWELSRTNRDTTAYRLLWFNWTSNPLALRVTQRGDSVTLTLIVLDGDYLMKPGAVAVRKTVTLSRAEWDGIVQGVDKAGYWSMPVRGDDDPSYRAGAYILEGARAGHYHAAERSDQDKGEFAALCRRMLDRSGFGYQATWGSNLGGGFR